jgi:hypothetical protein
MSMTTVRTTVKSGRVELAVPGDWPNGTEVEIRPVSAEEADEYLSPEEIAQTLAAMHAMKPLPNATQEHQQMEEIIRARKEREKVEFTKRLNRLQQGWDQ